MVKHLGFRHRLEPRKKDKRDKTHKLTPDQITLKRNKGILEKELHDRLLQPTPENLKNSQLTMARHIQELQIISKTHTSQGVRLLAKAQITKLKQILGHKE